MTFELRWTIDAVKDLRELNRATADRITKKVAWFVCQKNPLRHADALSGIYTGISRFRVGDYRVLFEINDEGCVRILTVLKIRHRSDVYRRG